MSIQYSGNADIYSFTTGVSTPSTDFENAVIANLQTAGWTLSTVAASDVLTFTGQPAANSTFSLDSAPFSQTYTFVAAGPTGNQILIDSSLANTLQNVLNALNSGPGSGTKYGSTLTPPPNMTATVTATALTVTYKTGGSAGNNAGVSTGGTINATWATSTLAGGLNKLTSAITPQGLQCRFYIYEVNGGFYGGGATNVQAYAGNRDDTRTGVVSAGNMMGGGPVGTNVNYKIIANKYQFFILVPGSQNTGTPGNGVAMGVPFITSNLVAPTISAATNANPVVCTISNHGFTNGDTVLIVGATGNTAINGQNIITVIDANTFSVPVTGNGTYNANSAYCSDLTIGNTINEAIWSAKAGIGAPSNFRNGGIGITTAFATVNANVLTGSSGTADVQIVTPASSNAATNQILQWFDNTFLISEPFLLWGISNGAVSKIVGQLWDAALIRDALTIDQTATFDTPAHTFWAAGVGSNNSLMFATTA